MTLALGERAVACRGWRWMPGVLASRASDLTARGFVLPGNVLFTPPQHARIISGRGANLVTIWDDAIPVMSHPATIGCLLALVREAWGDPNAYVAPADGWYVGICMGDEITITATHRGPTEAAALVAALEAAP